MTTYAMPGAIADVVGGGSPGRIEASWANAIRDRSCGNFATTSDRDTAIPSPKDGQQAYVTATHTLYIYNGSTWRAWDVTAQSYTPTLTQLGAVTKTVTAASYQRRGSRCAVEIRLDCTGSGTANNAIIISAPVTAARSGVYGGSGIVYDSSASTAYPSIIAMASTTTFQLVDATQPINVALFQGQTGSAFAAALASGDVITFGFEYDVA